MRNFPGREMFGVAATISHFLFTTTPAPAESTVNGQNVTAVSGVVTGNVQGVGFRAMIQKQAIQYNLAGSTENGENKSVQFVLQGDKNRINQAVMAIRDGTKTSSDVKVSLAPTAVDPDLNTFTAVGWTSLSRHITAPYNLVFNLRSDNTTIKKKPAKAIWLGICNSAVKNEDVGKCNKGDD
jgi:acylphosphatase